MPSSEAETLAALVRDAGGEIVGKMRLHYATYLVQLANLNESFSIFGFDYTSAGLFGQTIAEAIDKAKIDGLLQEGEYPYNSPGVYFLYKYTGSSPLSTNPTRIRFLTELARADPVDVELTATAAYFQAKQGIDPWGEVERKQNASLPDIRLSSAKDLKRSLSEICNQCKLRPEGT